MPRFRFFLALAALLAAVALYWRVSYPAHRVPPAVAAVHPAREAPAAPWVRTAAEESRAETLRIFAYAQRWHEPQSPVLAAFRDWAERYRAAAPAERAPLESAGIALARERRPIMRALIVSDPAEALALTVPAALRRELPAAVLAELEQRIAGTGDFGLLAMSYDGPPPPGAPTRRSIVFLRGETFTAHAYGRRAGQPTQEGASLHGIALEGEFALHESPLRVLEPGEPGAAAQEHCPVTGAAVPDRVLSAGANRDDINLVEAHGKIWEFCGGEKMLELLQQQLEAAEDAPGPRVAPLIATSTASPPPTAADAPTAWTLGVKRLLVLRVDFSDFPGEPVAAETLEGTLQNAVHPFFDDASYGQSGINATVSRAVYRMPRTGASYATADHSSQLHADARAAAAADYRIADYDRVMVVFGGLGPGRVTGSAFAWAGLALVNGTNSWINNSFSMGTIAHELGHNHGLRHSSLWVAPAGSNNPVSAVGSSREYGDPFDVMGNASDRDARHHYNHWCKNLLGWLPDASVTPVTRSGTYRVYRHDSKAAWDGQSTAATRPLALRIFRDGVRWYWVGYRQNFPSNNTLSAGANLLWGFNSSQESQLLDCATPGANALDSALVLGATLDDTVSGVKIRPVARGGEEPAQWLEVEITVPEAPPNQVAAWGGGQNFLDEPAAVANVPIDLKNVTMIAAGASHVIALKSDRTLAAWGSGLLGQLAFPQINELIVSIAAGGNVSGAITRDGKITLWGNVTAALTPPANLADVQQLAIGTNHIVALKTDGTLVGWGSNTAGQLDFSDTRDVAAIAAGNQTTIVLKRDGTVAAFGSATIRGVPPGLRDITAIAARGTHALALRADGTVVAWGNNGNGQINVPGGLRDVVAVAAGDFHSLALKADGSIAAWGAGGGRSTVPAHLPRAKAIAASATASFALLGPQVFITAQPVAQTVAGGSAVTLRVDAIGPGALTYQWRRDGVAIAGATASTLALPGVTTADVGAYDVVVRDGTTSLTSSPTRVALIAPPAGPQVARISNLSILTSLASRSDSFRLGFVVGGDGTSGRKPVVIRAVGPSLGALGVPGTLGDPTVTVFTGSTQIAGNDDWGGAVALTTAMAAVGAFPLANAGSFDAVVATDIAGRDNSVVVGSAFGGAASGAVIAEIYDATPASQFVATVPRLVNVSVLKNIGSSLTAGFVIAGPGGATKRVLVRAIGPGLTVFGLASGVVADPQIVLFRGQTALGINDDWGDAPALSSAFGAVGAFALLGSSRDAALLADLPPGDYSVVASPATGATGIALVEIYEVP